MLNSYKRGQTSIILRVKIRNTAVSTGAGLTGLAYNSSGLVISTLAENESSPTVYTAAGSTIETISTIGTYATPTATKCRFKEVDATNMPGIYEIQLPDARFAVSNAKYLLLSVFGATNAAECDAIIALTDINPYDGVRAGLTALPNAVAEAAGGLVTNGTSSGQITLSSGKVTVGTIDPSVVANASLDPTTITSIATAVWQDTTAGDFTVANSIGKSLYTTGNTPGSAGGLLIAGTNTGATSFTGGIVISSNSTYGLDITSSANSSAAVRIRSTGSTSNALLVQGAGAGVSNGIKLYGTESAVVADSGSTTGTITVTGGFNGSAITLLGGDGDVDTNPVVKIDTPAIGGIGVEFKNTGGGISTGVKISTGGTAINLENGSDQSTVRIVSVGTDCSAVDVVSATNYGAINVSSSAGVGVQVLASGGNAVDLTALSNGHGLSLTKNGSSYNDLNLANNDSGTWPIVQGYATGQAPLQPTVAGRTLNVSATGLGDTDVKAIAGNTTAATNQANAAAVVYSGTITSSPTTTTFRDTGLTQTDSNHWNGRVIIFLTGSLKYEGTKITAFDPTTDQLTFDALTSAPLVGNTYIIV